jgi:hypothetical protein
MPPMSRSTLKIFTADAATIRWNFPLFTDLESFDGLAVPSPVDEDVRARNKRRGSLFEVLIDLILQRISDDPVYVQFSGGCDSSLVLAAAVVACRRGGHDRPIPVTFRYPLLPETDENDFQLTPRLSPQSSIC